MALPAVDLVIVHRETPEPVLRTVADFLDQSLVPRIVVVDNGSTPGHGGPPARRSCPAGVELVEAGANTGFGPGANIGFRWFLAHDPAPWLAVCPHDAHPLPGCVERLVTVAAAQPRAGPGVGRRRRRPDARSSTATSAPSRPRPPSTRGGSRPATRTGR